MVFEGIQPDLAITALLADARRGDREALGRLVPLVDEQLRRIAHSHLRAERRGHTLQPTALIHEAYIRLLKGAQPDWESPMSPWNQPVISRWRLPRRSWR